MSNKIEPSLPSPVQKIVLDDALEPFYELYVKREDLIHPDFGGNKWRKLKYNLQAFREGNFIELVTFGGPFSNHIHAVSKIAQAHGIKSYGFIRGTYEDPGNPTLSLAKQAGMQLIHLSKSAYTLKEKAEEVKVALGNMQRPYLVPEGGSNQAALKGCMEIMEEIGDYDVVVVPAGTGTTAAGIVAASTNTEVVVIPVLKHQGMEEVIRNQVPVVPSFSVNHDYHFGGYAKVNQELIEFINAFRKQHHIALDPIYNAKGMYAVLDLMRKKRFISDAKVLYVLTGGLQGITAYNYCCKNSNLLIHQ